MTDSGHRRPLVAALTGVVGLALCAIPVFWTTVFAVAGFTGCFLECSEPEPAVGLLWGGIALLIGAVPIVVAALAGGYRFGTAVAAAAVGTVGLTALVVLGLGAL